MYPWGIFLFNKIGAVWEIREIFLSLFLQKEQKYRQKYLMFISFATGLYLWLLIVTALQAFLVIMIGWLLDFLRSIELV